MNVLVFGGAGQLGSEIATRWKANISAPPRSELDLCDAAASPGLLGGFDVVVNCAAFHNVDVCEAEAEEALRVNSLAVDRLARACGERGIVFVTVSTDYVFDGRKNAPYVESDCAHPLSAYGISKFAGELLVERQKQSTFVVRTSGVYGKNGSKSKGTFIDRIITQARNGEPIRVVADVVASPTYAGHLAEAMQRLIESEAYGLYHLCNAGAVSWYEFAKKALELAGLDHPIEPISSSEWKAAAVRPRYSALTSEKLPALGITMPTWEEGIAAYLRDKAS